MDWPRTVTSAMIKQDRHYRGNTLYQEIDMSRIHIGVYRILAPGFLTVIFFLSTAIAQPGLAAGY